MSRFRLAMYRLPSTIVVPSMAQSQEHNKNNPEAAKTNSQRDLPVVICPTSDFPKTCQALSSKIIRFIRSANHVYGSPVPLPTEGRIMIVTNVVRDAMDVLAAPDERSQCGRRSRVVLIPRRWD
jgi:hypothetical protein